MHSNSYPISLPINEALFSSVSYVTWIFLLFYSLARSISLLHYVLYFSSEFFCTNYDIFLDTCLSFVVKLTLVFHSLIFVVYILTMNSFKFVSTRSTTPFMFVRTELIGLPVTFNWILGYSRFISYLLLTFVVNYHLKEPSWLFPSRNSWVLHFNMSKWCILYFKKSSNAHKTNFRGWILYFLRSFHV